MAGVTATISRQEFSAAWVAGDPIRVLAARYTITREQVDRLRVVWSLESRRPGTGPKPRSLEAVGPAEEEASGATCDTAPEVARRIAELRQIGLIRGKSSVSHAAREVVFSARIFNDASE